MGSSSNISLKKNCYSVSNHSYWNVSQWLLNVNGEQCPSLVGLGLLYMSDFQTVFFDRYLCGTMPDKMSWTIQNRYLSHFGIRHIAEAGEWLCFTRMNTDELNLDILREGYQSTFNTAGIYAFWRDGMVFQRHNLASKQSTWNLHSSVSLRKPELAQSPDLLHCSRQENILFWQNSPSRHPLVLQ